MSKLKLVTISGADDDISVDKLEKLSAQYPFVEWAILMSPKNFGTPRYPSKDWLKRFAFTQTTKAMHLCGPAAKVFSVVDESKESNALLDEIYYETNYFDRVQVNLSRFIKEVDIKHIAYNMHVSLVDDYIIQVGLESNGFVDKIRKEVSKLDDSTKAYPFLDVSGGLGKSGEWKFDYNYKGFKGFAGGINPENVERVIASIKENLGEDEEFWIDMESGVRVNDKFDLARVEKVLSICEKYV